MRFCGYLSKPKRFREHKGCGKHWCNRYVLHPVAKVADVTVSNPNLLMVIIRPCHSVLQRTQLKQCCWITSLNWVTRFLKKIGSDLTTSDGGKVAWSQLHCVGSQIHCKAPLCRFYLPGRSGFRRLCTPVFGTGNLLILCVWRSYYESSSVWWWVMNCGGGGKKRLWDLHGVTGRNHEDV
jgi:hypothetical protein